MLGTLLIVVELGKTFDMEIRGQWGTKEKEE